MSTAALTPISSEARTATGSPGWAALFAVVVGLGYMLTDQSYTTSLADAYTQTADQMEAAVSGGNAIRRLSFLAFAGLGLLALLSPAPHVRTRVTLCGLMMVGYVGWCGLTVLWTDAPGTMLRRYFVLLCFALGAAGMAKQLTGRGLLKLVVGVTSVYLAAGFLAELSLGTFRPHASDYRFAGTMHPNTQGLNLAALVVAALLLARSESKSGRYWIAFGVGMLFLILTKSRTSTAGMFVSLALLWTFGTDFRIKTVVGLLGICLLSGGLLVAVFAGANPAEDAAGVALMGRGEQSESLTGRLPIWTAVAPYLMAQPIAGYGYDSFWSVKHIEAVTSEVQWGVRESHNAYFDTILNTGLIGLALLLAGACSAWLRSGAEFVRTKDPLPGFVFTLITFGLINGLTESGMIMPIYMPFVLTAATLHLAFFPDFVNEGESGASALGANSPV